jgi:hypothetical protein
MKSAEKNIVNQLIKKQTPLPNDDYFTDLSERLLTEIKQHKAPIVPIYKKLFFVVASSAAVLLIAISIFWKSNTNVLVPKQLVSQKTTAKTPVKVPVKTLKTRVENTKAVIENNVEKTEGQTPIPIETIEHISDDVVTFESLEKAAIYSYLLNGSDELDEEQLSNLLSN